MARRERPTRMLLSQAYVQLAKLAAHPSLSSETRRLMLAALAALDRELEARSPQKSQYLDCEPTEPSAEPTFDFDDEPTGTDSDESTRRMTIG